MALAAKGGIDAPATRQEYPRIAEALFDAAYKLMATFHNMTNEDDQPVVRCMVKGAPDQLLGRASSALDAELHMVLLDTVPLAYRTAMRDLVATARRRLVTYGDIRGVQGIGGRREEALRAMPEHEAHY